MAYLGKQLGVRLVSANGHSKAKNESPVCLGRCRDVSRPSFLPENGRTLSEDTLHLSFCFSGATWQTKTRLKQIAASKRLSKETSHVQCKILTLEGLRGFALLHNFGPDSHLSRSILHPALIPRSALYFMRASAFRFCVPWRTAPVQHVYRMGKEIASGERIQPLKMKIWDATAQDLRPRHRGT